MARNSIIHGFNDRKQPSRTFSEESAAQSARFGRKDSQGFSGLDAHYAAQNRATAQQQLQMRGRSPLAPTSSPAPVTDPVAARKKQLSDGGLQPNEVATAMKQEAAPKSPLTGPPAPGKIMGQDAKTWIATNKDRQASPLAPANAPAKSVASTSAQPPATTLPTSVPGRTMSMDASKPPGQRWGLNPAPITPKPAPVAGTTSPLAATKPSPPASSAPAPAPAPAAKPGNPLSSVYQPPAYTPPAAPTAKNWKSGLDAKPVAVIPSESPEAKAQRAANTPDAIAARDLKQKTKAWFPAMKPQPAPDLSKLTASPLAPKKKPASPLATR